MCKVFDVIVKNIPFIEEYKSEQIANKLDSWTGWETESAIETVARGTATDERKQFQQVELQGQQQS